MGRRTNPTQSAAAPLALAPLFHFQFGFQFAAAIGGAENEPGAPVNIAHAIPAVLAGLATTTPLMQSLRGIFGHDEA